MSEPELEFEIDEFGCIRYRVTNEGALLSKDEKEFIIDYVTRMQVENAKLRELVSGLEYCVQGYVCDSCPLYDPSGTNHRRCESLERELGIEVDE